MQNKSMKLVFLSRLLLSIAILLGIYSVLDVILFSYAGNHGIFQEFLAKNAGFVIFLLHLPLAGFILSFTTIPGLGLEQYFYTVMPISASGLSVAKSLSEPFMSSSVLASSLISLIYGISSFGLLKSKNWARKSILILTMTLFGIELISLSFWVLTINIGGVIHLFVVASMMLPLSIMGLILGYLYRIRSTF